MAVFAFTNHYGVMHYAIIYTYESKLG